MLEEHNKSKDLDEKALDKPELVDGVQAKLDALNITSKDEPAVSDDDEPDDSTPVVKVDKEVVKDDKADEKEVVDDPTPVVEDVKKDSILPDAFKRAAIHQGWKSEDVDEFFATKPDAALRTFENIYNSTNTLSRHFADLGRTQRQLAAVKDEPKKVEVKKVDIEKLKTEYDLDSETIAALTEQNRQIDTLVAERNVPKANVEREMVRGKVAADAIVEQQIANYFETEPMKPYKKFYGELDLGMSWQDLTAGQKENRFKVLEQADLMIAGATLQGHTLNINDALELAHLLVTEPVRERIIREQIKEQATRRTKTLKPSGRKVETNVSDSVTDGKPRTREEIESKAAKKLAKIFRG